ncbi:hypothetical protein RUM43_010429 [Polyplax serrata]|uniref:Uncharacterized protein n=1 Tax=Polyplax serrata TaxID=468196 RepID=A0AAN8PVS6_POLSC
MIVCTQGYCAGRREKTKNREVSISDDGTRPFLRKTTRDHRELKQAKRKQRHREVGGGGGGSIEEINRRGSPDVKT